MSIHQYHYVNLHYFDSNINNAIFFQSNKIQGKSYNVFLNKATHCVFFSLTRNIARHLINKLVSLVCQQQIKYTDRRTSSSTLSMSLFGVAQIRINVYKYRGAIITERRRTCALCRDKWRIREDDSRPLCAGAMVTCARANQPPHSLPLTTA